MEMVSSRKILWHRQKVASFLAGEPVFPVTLELGLTTVCDRSCRDCPSRLGQPGLFLSLDTARRLFDLCRGKTFGVIISGGEPTLHPDFGLILSSARERGFRDVVVISNGSRLDCEEVMAPLLRHASAVRVSLYDWEDGMRSEDSPTLRRIKQLRAAIEKSGSSLQIGTSLLTREASGESLSRAAAALRAAGAHWLYLHPTCISSGRGMSRLRGHQGHLLEILEACRREQAPGFPVYFLAQRYSTEPVVFQGYHAAHFIMVVGADGHNYLSSETKYRARFRITSQAEYAGAGFFATPGRRARIAAVCSSSYPAGGSRNRGVLYNQVLENVRRQTGGGGVPVVPDFLLPHIL